MEGLTDKQKRFCEEYIIDLNGAQSAIRAGYAEGSARVEGSRLLSNDNIQEYISQLQQNKSEELNITFNDIATGVYNIAKKEDARDNDKLKAFDQLSKMFGHYEKDNSQKKTDVILPTEIVFTKGAKK